MGQQCCAGGDAPTGITVQRAVRPDVIMLLTDDFDQCVNENARDVERPCFHPAGLRAGSAAADFNLKFKVSVESLTDQQQVIELDCLTMVQKRFHTAALHTSHTLPRCIMYCIHGAQHADVCHSVGDLMFVTQRATRDLSTGQPE